MIRSATSKMSCRLCEISTTARPCSARRADEIEHLPRLGDAERGRRLVEDHDAGVPEHRARDRDRLALAARERRDELAGRADRRDRERLQRLAPCWPPSTGSLRRWKHVVHLAPEVHVLDDVEVVAEREVLVDDLDAEARRVLRAVDRDRLALEEDLAAVERVDAGDALDERRLAAPLSPTSAITSPRAPRSRRRVSACTEPKRFEMPRSSSVGVSVAVAAFMHGRTGRAVGGADAAPPTPSVPTCSTSRRRRRRRRSS